MIKEFSWGLDSPNLDIASIEAAKWGRSLDTNKVTFVSLDIITTGSRDYFDYKFEAEIEDDD